MDGQHQVGLLDHLLAVEVEVRVVQQQRVALLGGVVEVPDRVLGEPLVLRVHPETPVVRHHHRLGRVPPAGRLFGADPELLGHVVVLLGQVGRGGQVPLGHQVGEDVVVFDRAVLVGAGDPVDTEPALGVVVADAAPQPRRLDQDLDADLALELLVPGGVDVVEHGPGDVGVDVERGRAGRPVTRTLLAVDRAPRERGALQAQVGGALPGQREHRVAPAQRVRRRRGLGEVQHREHERLGVPERVPVVAGTGQAFGRDRPDLGAGAGLQNLEQREPDRLLNLRVAGHLDVSPGPEVVQERPLLGQQLIPAGELGQRQRRGHLIVHGRPGPDRRPAVADVLGDVQLLAQRDLGRDQRPAHVGVGLAVDGHPGRALDLVQHPGRDPQPADPGAVHQDGAALAVIVGDELLADQRGLQGGGRAWVAAAVRHLLVGHQLGLGHQPDLALDRFHRVGDGGDGPLGQRHHPGRGDPDPRTRGRGPVRVPGQRACPQVEHAIVRVQRAVADVERLIVDQQPDQLAVGDVDGRLTRLGVAVARLGVRQRALLEERVQVRAGQAVRLSLVQVAAQPDVPVGEGKDRLALGEQIHVEPGLLQTPRLNPVCALLDHALAFV